MSTTPHTNDVPPAQDTPRNRHYGDFYGLTQPDPSAVTDGRPLLVVHGNCQAESLRVLLDGRYGDRIRTARLVPAHELVEADVPHLLRVLADATYLVTQPVVAGYRGLPVGTSDLLAAAPHLRTAVVPVMRWAGLHPTQAIVRTPAGDPPVVPYHDLRTVAACRRTDAAASIADVVAARPTVSVVAVSALRDASLGELTRRIEAHHAVDVRDVFTRAGRRSAYVINHPTNDALVEVADLVAASLGLGAPREFDPGRTLLGSVVAPLNLDAAALAQVPVTDDDIDAVWRVQGVAVPDEDVAGAHVAWYREHPQALADAVARHGGLLDLMEVTA